MNNLPLQPLVWHEQQGRCFAKSPITEYETVSSGDKYKVYYTKRRDNYTREATGFATVNDAKAWAWNHYNEKMQPYVKPAPTWIDASERLPESECFYLVRLFDGHRDEHVFVILWWNSEHRQFLEWDAMCEPTHWMPIPEFSTMQILHKGGVIMNGFKLCTNCGKKRFMDSDRYHPMDGKGVCHECQLRSEADND